jgi:hypothetical protein
MPRLINQLVQAERGILCVHLAFSPEATNTISSNSELCATATFFSQDK